MLMGRELRKRRAMARAVLYLSAAEQETEAMVVRTMLRRAVKR